MIANIDNDKGAFSGDIIVETGRGYRTVDESTSKRYVDYIAIDSLFIPVLRVRYKVEPTRVGQITDFDKLVITVETVGSITPREAFEEASAILVSQHCSSRKTTVESVKLVEDTAQLMSSRMSQLSL